jgi:uncharacterized DUF497 family protein
VYNAPMAGFEWDDDKAKINERDHGISFDEAKEVFNDDFAIEEYDETHTNEELRFHIIGLSSRRLLMVVYAEREGEVIRIISAWKAGKKYRKAYEENKQEG